MKKIARLELTDQARRERRLKLAAVMVLIAAALATILLVNNMLLAFICAFVINYLLSPIADFFESRGFSRYVAVSIPFALGGIVILLGIVWLLPAVSEQISTLESQFPKYQTDLVNLMGSLEQRFSGLSRAFNIHLATELNSWLLAKTTQLSSSLPNVISLSFTVLLLSPLFAFFMLLDGRNISRSFFDLVPNHLFELSLNLHHQINIQLGDFIRARILESIIVGGLVWIGFIIIGFPYATLLAAFAAVMNLIPYIGPILGAVPAVIIAYVSKDGHIADPMSLNLLIVTSVYFVAQIVDVALIIPLLVAKIVNLHPATVIIVIIIGAQVMGILGMVISIPVASAIKLLSVTLYEHLLGTKPNRMNS